MPRVSSVDALPEDIRAELAAGLKGSGWGDIDKWTEWLNGKGFEISRPAVGRFNKRTKDRFQQTWIEAEQTAALAKILVANSTDDGGAVLRANELLASSGLLRMQGALRELEDQIDDMETPEEAQQLTIKLAETQAKMVRGVSELNKAGIARAKWQEQMNAKMKESLDAIEGKAKAGEIKLDADALKAIRQEIYGLL